MKPIQLPLLTDQQLDELNELYRKTRDPRQRTRAQIILLAAEKELVAEAIGAIVRLSDQAVRKWLKRYMAEGIKGLNDMPRAGSPRKVTPGYLEKLEAAVRRRPRSLDLPFSMWTLQRLSDYLAEETGLRVEAETVRLHLKKLGVVLSRPQHKVSSPDADYLVKKRRWKTSGAT